MLWLGDTDSCDATTCISINNENNTIENVFEKNVKNGLVETLTNGTEVLTPFNKLITKSLNGDTKIKNISRHKVSKDKWTISIDNNKIEVTKDHSIMVYRDGQIIECKPEDIKDTDYLIFKK